MHASFSRPGGGGHVQDAGSRNGTWINGVRAPQGERVPLPDGSVLRMGKTLMIVRDAFAGSFQPGAPIGELVGPFGLRACRYAIDRIVRQRPGTVLIEGETGTGKELAALAVAHALGRAQPYGTVNVAGVPAGVFESQLFGYVRGSFSGAGTGSRGVFLAHNGGAVFLDAAQLLGISRGKLRRLMLRTS